MNNVEMTQEGNILVIKIDTTKRFGKSQGGKGKNTIVATTGGNIVTASGVTVGLNAYVRE